MKKLIIWFFIILSLYLYFSDSTEDIRDEINLKKFINKKFEILNDSFLYETDVGLYLATPPQTGLPSTIQDFLNYKDSWKSDPTQFKVIRLISKGQIFKIKKIFIINKKFSVRFLVFQAELCGQKEKQVNVVNLLLNKFDILFDREEPNFNPKLVKEVYDLNCQ